MKPTIFLDPAETEMLEAARFYESNAAGLLPEFFWDTLPGKILIRLSSKTRLLE